MGNAADGCNLLMSLDPLSDLLGPMLERLGMSRPDVLNRIVSDWAEVACEPWVSRSKPLTLSRGELIVAVASGTDASLLRYRTGELLAALDRSLGGSMVETVRIKVDGRHVQ